MLRTPKAFTTEEKKPGELVRLSRHDRNTRLGGLQGSPIPCPQYLSSLGRTAGGEQRGAKLQALAPELHLLLSCTPAPLPPPSLPHSMKPVPGAKKVGDSWNQPKFHFFPTILGPGSPSSRCLLSPEAPPLGLQMPTFFLSVSSMAFSVCEHPWRPFLVL